MDPGILERLCPITPEEQAILDGRTSIDRDIYMQGQDNTVNSRKLLSSGKLITLRPHTRFIDFPQHRHDYVEMVYMCTGSTVHLVNGKQIQLQQGELLLLSQSVIHEVLCAEQQDVAINFIILPDFFSTALSAMGEEETPLRKFLIDCLCGQNTGHNYLHFQISQVKPLQNRIENLIWALLWDTPNRRKVSQMTMATLFLQLMGNMDTLITDGGEEAAVWQVLRYVEQDYIRGSLSDIAGVLHYDVCWLSREIKRKTGKTYTQIVQDKRLAQAAFLLKNTDRNICDISIAVGYENISYFHRIFANTFGKSPRQYRMQERTLF
jgi:AraC-like DNA-binding protein